MSDVVLSAGVRQNLLALQSTANLMSITQNRLATGKKVNSALDNPGNFFTSQSLNNRASDLNALLDSIGQAQKTIEAADQGITSLTKLVESAKSVAKQALQAPQPASATYNAVTLGSDPVDEVLGTTGAGATVSVANSTTYSFTIDIAGGAAATTVSLHVDARTPPSTKSSPACRRASRPLWRRKADTADRSRSPPTAPPASKSTPTTPTTDFTIGGPASADRSLRQPPTTRPACWTPSARPPATP